MKNHKPLIALGLILLALIALLAYCNRPGPPVDPTPAPATVTATRPPTMTPTKVVATRPPTKTPSPTATQVATITPSPTATATQVPTVTATPVIRVILEGYISKYAPGVFEQSIAHQEAQGWHDYPDDLAQFAGFLALAECDRKGQTLWARPASRGGPWRPFLVADCAGDDATRQWMAEHGIVAEVDHQTWVEWRPLYATRYGIPIQIGVIEND